MRDVWRSIVSSSEQRGAERFLCLHAGVADCGQQSVCSGSTEAHEGRR